MTVLTGETGAGKTLVVDAIELLLGGPADAMLVRPGATEAVVEGRFAWDRRRRREVVLTRVVPAVRAQPGLRRRPDGRRRRSWPSSAGRCVDLHGQHAHQSLLAPPAQRAALDAVRRDQHRLRSTAARRRVRDIEAALDALGGDPRARARELDLLALPAGRARRGAGLDDRGRGRARSGEEEERLADAVDLRGARPPVRGRTSPATTGWWTASATWWPRLAGRPPLGRPARAATSARGRAVGRRRASARTVAETFEDDPGRLAEIGRPPPGAAATCAASTATPWPT